MSNKKYRIPPPQPRHPKRPDYSELAKKYKLPPTILDGFFNIFEVNDENRIFVINNQSNDIVGYTEPVIGFKFKYSIPTFRREGGPGHAIADYCFVLEKESLVVPFESDKPMGILRVDATVNSVFLDGSRALSLQKQYQFLEDCSAVKEPQENPWLPGLHAEWIKILLEKGYEKELKIVVTACELRARNELRFPAPLPEPLEALNEIAIGNGNNPFPSLEEGLKSESYDVSTRMLLAEEANNTRFKKFIMRRLKQARFSDPPPGA